MARVQLREIRTAAEETAFYERRYPRGYRHEVWPDHVERIAASAELIRRYSSQIRTAADLSCGDCALISRLDLETAYVGDLIGARGEYPMRPNVRVLPAGPLPDSLDGFRTIPGKTLPVDLFILSETLEHVPDPDTLLAKLTDVSRYLFLSTPLDEPASTGNEEHYWGWGQSDIHHLLWESGWSPMEVSLFTPESTRDYAEAYTFQLWMAVRR